MMGRKSKLKGGEEWDLLFGRSLYCYLQRAGATRSIKKRINRRERRNSKQENVEE